ncbi:MAG: hypothetical protein E3K37_06545 [Candidatus Kuenenia sp.]|nr:hypothetical protein [Candidatus Kuenenia hertensis]
MLINWFTVFAQIFNFLLLVFLLKHFLYGRIISAMNVREEKIASRLQEAEQKMMDAEHERDLYFQKNKENDERCAGLFASANLEAEAQKKELIENARRQVDEMKKRWNESLREERDVFLSNLRKRAEKQIYIILGKIFSDLSNTKLEQNIVETFLGKIKSLDHTERNHIKVILKESYNKAVISSTYEIPVEQQHIITAEIGDAVGETVEIRYINSQDHICGIEFKVKNYRIGWNVDDYVKFLEREVNKTLEEELAG